MSHDDTPNGKSISREELIRRHQNNDWTNTDAGEWNEFSRRALSGLQYHSSGEPLEDTFRRIENRAFPSAPPQGRRFILRRILSIAAGLAFLVLAGYLAYFRPPSNEKMFAQHFEYLPSAVPENGAARNAGPAQASLRAAAVQAYETEQYREAEGLARAYLESEPNDQEMRFYYGILLLGKGDASSAIPHLAAVKQNPVPAAYERPATWYLALAYLKRGQDDTAKRLFAELKEGKDRYARQARAVLKKL